MKRVHVTLCLQNVYVEHITNEKIWRDYEKNQSITTVKLQNFSLNHKTFFFEVRFKDFMVSEKALLTIFTG